MGSDLASAHKSINVRVGLSVVWGSVGVGFGVRFKAPSPPGSCRSVHDA